MAGIYTEFYNKYIEGIKDYCRTHERNLAFQGEIIGQKIQKNHYDLDSRVFLLFDIFDIDKQEYLKPYDRMRISETLKISHVPVIERHYNFTTVEEEIKKADGRSLLNQEVIREGVVFKSNDSNFSFKLVSNAYLLH